MPSNLANNNIFKKKYVQVDANNEVIGFYIDYDDLTHPTDNTYELTQDSYQDALTNLNKHKYYVEDTSADTFTYKAKDIDLSTYKTLKCAEIVYYYRQLLSQPVEYNGNYFDVYYLRNNYYDLRLVQELSLNKSTGSNIKIQTINNEQVTMSSEDFLQFYNTFTGNINALLNKQSDVIDQISDAESVEDINTILTTAYDAVSVRYPSDSIFMPVYETSNTYMTFVDAPNDGKAYVRQNKNWTVANTEVTSPINITTDTNVSSKVDEAPNDNNIYGRNRSAWKQIKTAWRLKA